jgi:hypothetical protein
MDRTVQGLLGDLEDAQRQVRGQAGAGGPARPAPRPRGDRVPDYSTDTLPGSPAGPGRPPHDTLPDYSSDTLPGPHATTRGGAQTDDALTGRGTRRGMGPQGPSVTPRERTLPGVGPEEASLPPRQRTIPGVGAEGPGTPPRERTIRGMGPDAFPSDSSTTGKWSRSHGRDAPAAQGQRSLPDNRSPMVDAGRSDRPSAAMAESGRAAGSRTATPLSDDHIQLLGLDVADKAARLGITDGELVGHMWKEQFNLTLRGLGPKARREVALDMLRDQITRTHALGEDLGRKLIQYGYTPGDIAPCLDRFEARGLSRDLIHKSLDHEAQLMDHLKDVLLNGSLEKARVRLAALHSARQAIKVEVWSQHIEAWHASNPLEAPGRARLEEFSNIAEKYAQDLEQRLRGAARP